MATSPSFPQDPPQALILAQPSSTASRRLPPPCWSHDETVALIDAYREKWYSLRRGNLRATHWQEVADTVATRCPLSSGNPQKTSVQCRHKMEKLRKRYRAEIQRAASTPKGHRYCSSWVHFRRMDSMEKGSSPAVPVNPDPLNLDEEEEDEENQEELYPRGVKQAVPLNQSFYGSMNNGIRIKIPGRPTVAAPPVATMYSKFDEYPNSSPNPNYGSTKISRDGCMGRFGKDKNSDRGGRKREGNPLEEMVSAIKMLGDGFVKMERMKMEMAREVEGMRMEMEMKRTEMILESQERIVDTFAKALLETKNKKVKRMPTPES